MTHPFKSPNSFVAAAAPLTVLESPTIVLAEENIDTDQIIPARFLTTTTRHGLGNHAFADWRRQHDGTLRLDCPLNRPDAATCKVIVAGRNFGCGSSREHAAWALADMGIRAVISSELPDIFASNAVKNGIIPIVAGQPEHRVLLDSPFTNVRVDLRNMTVEGEHDLRFAFHIEPFARYCLLHGLDHLGYLLQQMPAIDAFMQTHRNKEYVQ